MHSNNTVVPSNWRATFQHSLFPLSHPSPPLSPSSFAFLVLSLMPVGPERHMSHDLIYSSGYVMWIDRNKQWFHRYPALQRDSKQTLASLLFAFSLLTSSLWPHHGSIWLWQQLCVMRAFSVFLNVVVRYDRDYAWLHALFNSIHQRWPLTGTTATLQTESRFVLLDNMQVFAYPAFLEGVALERVEERNGRAGSG